MIVDRRSLNAYPRKLASLSVVLYSNGGITEKKLSQNFK